MDFRDLSVTLSDSTFCLTDKISAVEKYVSGDDECKNYYQYIINWICVSLEYVTKANQYILENKDGITQMMTSLNECVNKCDQFKWVLHLKPTIHEVFLKLLKTEGVIDEDILICCWYSIMKNGIWRKPYFIKPNLLVDALAAVLDNSATCATSEDSSDKKLQLLQIFLEIYLKYSTESHNSKKGLLSFCKKILKPLLHLYVTQHEEQINIHVIKQILSTHLCNKDALDSLKMLLSTATAFEGETVKKKMKVEPSVNIFDILSTCSKEENLEGNIIFAVPMIYEITILGARKKNVPLKTHEEFLLLQKLTTTFKMEEDLKTNVLNVVSTYKMLVGVIHEYNLYKNVIDAQNDNTFFEWMENLVVNLLKIYDSECSFELKTTILTVYKLIININHLVIAPHMSKIIKTCAIKSSDLIVEHQGNLLNNVLDVYNQLNQLDYLMNNFEFVINKESDIISIRQSFTSRFSVAISMLETTQITKLLNEFSKKYETITENNSLTSQQQWFIYIWGYLLLQNASIIPENGYLKKEHRQFLKTLNELKIKNDKIIKSEKDESMKTMGLLIHHGINEIYLMLKEFDLLEEDLLNTISVKDVLSNDFVEVNFVAKYLKVCLLFDELVKGDNIECLEDEIKQLQKDITHNKLTDIWNKQIMTLSQSNYVSAIHQLLSDKQIVLLSLENNNVIKSYASLIWRNVIVETKLPLKSCISTTLISCFNYEKFQASLVLVILDDLKEILADELIGLNIEELIKDKNEEKLMLLINQVSSKDKYGKVKKANIQKAIVFLQGIKSLPLHYFESYKLAVLSLLVLVVEHSINIVLNRDIGKLVLQAYGQIVDGMLLWLPKTSLLPVHKYFQSAISFYNHSKEPLKGSDQTKALEDDEAIIFSLFGGALVKFNVKDTTSIDSVIAQIEVLLDAKLLPNQRNIRFGVALCGILCKTFFTFLQEPMVKSRHETNILKIVQQLSKLVWKTYNGYNISINTTVYKDMMHCYGLFCRIVLHGVNKVKNVDSLKETCDELINVFDRYKNMLHTYLCLPIDSHIKYLEILRFIYCSSHEFNLRMRALFIQEKELIPSILKKINRCENEYFMECYNELVKDVILNAPDKNLLELLNLLYETMTTLNDGKISINIAGTLTFLFNSKWTKEQRIILWNILPKVLICGVNSLHTVCTPYDVMMLLRLLKSVINISKHSLMSQYMSYIYHAFITLDQKHNESQIYFEDLYQVASQFLFNHEKIVYLSLSSYINVVKSIFNHLVKYTNVANKTGEEINPCVDRMSRLYKEIGSHKTHIAKYAPYLIISYIKLCQTAKFTKEQKKTLDSGIYFIMDACSDFEYSLLNGMFDNNDREYFRHVKTNYEKFHKFKG